MSQGRTILYGGYPVISANPSQYPAAAHLANSYTCPLGPAAGVGYLLMLQHHVAALLDSGSHHALYLEVTGQNARQVSFPKLFIDRAVRVSGGSLAADPNAATLVRVVDIRYHLTRWTSTPVPAQYNVRAWAGGSRDYIAETINDGTPWTWNEVLEKLWDACGMLGEWEDVAGLDDLPEPENLHLTGMNAWQALNMLLDKVGHTTCYNPQTATISIKAIDSLEDTGLDAPPVLYHGNPANGPGCAAPETIRVFFPVLAEDYGTERDTASSGNWATSHSGYYIDRPTGISGAVPGTVLSLWDSTPAIRQHGTAPTSSTFANSSQLSAIATQRKDAWLDSRKATATTRRHIIFSGLHIIGNAGNARRIVWRDHGSEAGGLVTELMAFPGLDKTADPALLRGGAGNLWAGEDDAQEAFLPHDFGRATWPTYPRLPNYVTVTFGGPEEDGSPYEGNGIFGGQVVRYNPATKALETLEDCWIKVVGEGDADSESQRSASNGDVLLGRLSGQYTATSGTHAGTRLPLYVVREISSEAHKPAVMVQLNSDLSQWVNGEEFEPGCQSQSGTVVSACSSSAYLVGQTVDVVFPHVRDRIVAVKSGDQVSAVMINSETSPLRFAVTSDYTRGGVTVVKATLNSTPAQWDNEEYEPGVQTTSATVTQVSEGGVVEVDELIDIEFPHVEGLEIAVQGDDIVSAVLIDETTSPKRFVITSDYTKSSGESEPGCGLKKDEDGNLAFDAEAVAGAGLGLDSTCKLTVSPGAATTNVELVADVECNEEGGWDVTTVILKFDANGLFVGTE